MLQNKIEALTRQLNQVRISQDRLRQQERQIVRAIIETYEEAEAQQRAPNTGNTPPGRDKSQEARSKDQKPRSTKQTTGKPKEEVVIGSRVRIRNPKPPAGTNTVLQSDTQGTVTRKSKFFIFVNTDNPKSTQDIRRSRSNIEPLP